MEIARSSLTCRVEHKMCSVHCSVDSDAVYNVRWIVMQCTMFGVMCSGVHCLVYSVRTV